MKFLAGLLAFSAPALAGDVEVRALGTVVSGTPPSSGPLAGVAIGDPVTLSFEVDLPVHGNASGGNAFTWMDNASFQLRIGAAVEVHRYPAGGLCWWVDDVLGIDGIQVREEALATPGLRVRMRLHDLTHTVFDAPDPLPYAGIYGPATFGDATWGLLGTSNLTFTFHSVTISTPDIGTSYCGPATPNSSGTGATIRAIGSQRVAARRVRLEAADMPPQTFGYALTSTAQGLVPLPGGSQGALCLDGSIGRFVDDIQTTGATGTMAVEVNPLALPQPTGAVTAQVGQTWSFQIWFRDANPGVTSNFTDGVAVTLR